MSHYVTITALPDETTDDYEYTFGGAHDIECYVLGPCKRRTCQGLKRHYEDGDERRSHGVLHEYRDGEWLVESGGCALDYVFECRTDYEMFDGIQPGTYPVNIMWDDCWWLEVARDTHTATTKGRP